MAAHQRFTRERRDLNLTAHRLRPALGERIQLFIQGKIFGRGSPSTATQIKTGKRDPTGPT